MRRLLSETFGLWGERETTSASNLPNLKQKAFPTVFARKFSPKFASESFSNAPLATNERVNIFRHTTTLLLRFNVQDEATQYKEEEVHGYLLSNVHHVYLSFISIPTDNKLMLKTILFHMIQAIYIKTKHTLQSSRLNDKRA